MRYITIHLINTHKDFKCCKFYLKKVEENILNLVVVEITIESYHDSPNLEMNQQTQ